MTNQLRELGNQPSRDSHPLNIGHCHLEEMGRLSIQPVVYSDTGWLLFSQSLILLKRNTYINISKEDSNSSRWTLVEESAISDKICHTFDIYKELMGFQLSLTALAGSRDDPFLKGVTLLLKRMYGIILSPSCHIFKYFILCNDAK